MTVVPGRLRVGCWARLGPTTAALGPPTSVGVGCSLQAASRATSAEVTIKRRCIDVLLRGKRSMHGNPSRCLCLLRLSIIAGPLAITPFYYCRIVVVVLPWQNFSVGTRDTEPASSRDERIF